MGYSGSGASNVRCALTDVVGVAGGTFHTLVLKCGGAVVAWGCNGDGQTSVPIGLTDVVDVDAGAYYSVALKADGTVVGWGADSSGQTSVPSGLTDVVDVDAGLYHSLAVTNKIDTTAPSVSCNATPSTLRTSANNHKLVNIAASVNVTDNFGGSGADGFNLVSVTSNQADSGLGRDDVPNDIQGWALGTADLSGQLRAERYRTDRTYTLTYQGTDLAGNTQNCQTTVKVHKG